MDCQAATQMHHSRMGANLRHLLGMHDLRQGDLAKHLGISVQALWNILHGRSRPRSATARRAADAFGISVEALDGDTGACLRAAAAAYEAAPVREARRPSGDGWRARAPAS
jgi:transcriptional regulator with XRE-family HTH domain